MAQAERRVACDDDDSHNDIVLRSSWRPWAPYFRVLRACVGCGRIVAEPGWNRHLTLKQTRIHAHRISHELAQYRLARIDALAVLSARAEN